MIVRVVPDTPYRLFALGSTQTTQLMRIFRYQFPDEYDHEKDVMISKDHDHLPWAEECIQRHTGRGSLVLHSWSCPTDQMFAFLVDILRVDPKVKWTGFRVLGGKNLASGWTIWTFELFAKDGKVVDVDSSIASVPAEHQVG